MAISSKGIFTSALAIAAAMAATSASAQDAPAADASASSGDIIVTAQRRSERSLNVPITITTVTSDQLESAGVTQLSDVARVSPALRFDSAANFVQPTIRGVGTAVTTSGGGANVGIYVDGFYSPNPAAADFELMKLQSIQVLKGPQGTLFGRNTTGGAILLSTTEPSSTPGGEIKASFGSYNAHKIQAYGTTGFGENLAIDAEGLFSKGDGWVKNITTGKDTDGDYENWSARAGVKWEPTDGFSALFRYTHSNTDDPTMLNTNIYTGPDIGVGTNLPAILYTADQDQVARPVAPAFLATTDAAQLTLKADLGWADLTSYSQYRTEDSLMVEDLDHTAANIFFLHIGVKDETVSQEFLLTSKPGTRLQWTAGAFYFNSEDIWTTKVGTPTATNRFANFLLGGSGTTTQSLALFADATYELTEKLFLTGGLRYSEDKVADPYYISTAFSATPLLRVNTKELDGDKVTPRVVLRYKPTDESSVYASYAKGYKAGIVDVGGATGDLVNPEDIDAYEIGYKYDDRRLSFDLSAYYYDYKDLQVSLFITGANGSPSAKLINAAKSTIYGLEGQGRFKVTDNFEISGGAAWTHARYDEFNNAPVYTRCTLPACAAQGISFAVVPTTLRDVEMQRTPEFTANIGARYTTPLAEGELALSGNLYYTSDFNFGPSGTQFPQDAYEVLGLRAEWTDPSDHYMIAVFGDNVTDSRYRTQVLYNNFGVGSVWNKPATVGVQVGAKF